MNQTQTDTKYLIVVEHDTDAQVEFREALARHKDVKAFVTNSIVEACVRYMLWLAKGIMPRAIIADWDVIDCEAQHFDERDSCTKSGAHFLLSQCADDHMGCLVTHTRDPETAIAKLSRSIESAYVQVVNRNILSPRDIVEYVYAKAFAPAHIDV